MTKHQNSQGDYDLEERTFQFAKAVRLFVKTLPRTITILVKGYFVIVIASVSQRSNPLKIKRLLRQKAPRIRVKSLL